MVLDRKGRAELRIFVLHGVETVRAVGQHGLYGVTPERLDVFTRALLKESLFSRASRGIARAALATACFFIMETNFLNSLCAILDSPVYSHNSELVYK